MFIDTKLIKVLDQLREHFNRPITVNNWMWGGNLEQRGLRANLDELVKNKTEKRNFIYFAGYLREGCRF